MDEPTSPTPNRTYFVIAEFESRDSRAAFVEKLRTYDGFCPLTDLAWCVRTSSTVSEVRDELIKIATGAKDRIYVFSGGGSGAWRNAMGPKHTDWLKKFL